MTVPKWVQILVLASFIFNVNVFILIMWHKHDMLQAVKFAREEAKADAKRFQQDHVMYIITHCDMQEDDDDTYDLIDVENTDTHERWEITVNVTTKHAVLMKMEN